MSGLNAVGKTPMYRIFTVAKHEVKATKPMGNDAVNDSMIELLAKNATFITGKANMTKADAVAYMRKHHLIPATYYVKTK